MPDISLPEIHLPDVKLPEGLRDMSRDDIQRTIGDRMPRKLELPDVDLSKIDLSKIDLPKALEDRLPRRKRSNPILPIAAFVAIGSLIAAAWWLITSPTAMVRVRETADRIRSRMGMTGVDELDAEDRLETLLPPESSPTRPGVENETWPASVTDVGDEVRTGNGLGAERPAGV